MGSVPALGLGSHFCEVEVTSQNAALSTQHNKKGMNKNTIGQAELDVLKFIAENGPSTVRAVADHFGASKGYQRPTLMKMMERLRVKGFLAKEASESGFRYSSISEIEELDRDMIGRFVEGPLAGSLTPMVRYLVERKELTEQEIEDLKKLVDKLERKR